MIIGYPVPGKEKARIICQAFIDGAPHDAEGDVFFGVNHGNHAAYLRAKALGRPWFYVDNAYFDRCRGVYFRVTRNALQCNGADPSDGKRFEHLGISIKPWRVDSKPTNTLLVCEQNANFMAAAVGYKGGWLTNTLSALRGLGLPHPIKVRPWNPDKAKLAIALLDQLPTTHMVITHSSASAITAMLEGVPAISQSGAAAVLTGKSMTFADISLPRHPSGREQFAATLADNQFTLDEIRRGMAWQWLNREK